MVRTLLDVLLRPAQDLEDRLPRYQVLPLVRPQQGLLVVVVERVDPVLAHVMVAFFCKASRQAPLLRSS